MPKTLIDTNIFVYAIDRADPKKQSIARQEIDRLEDAGDAVVSTQILQEFYAVVTRKLGHDPLTSKLLVQEMAENELVVIDLALIETAVDISVINRISFWDSVLLASADAANCSILMTEDLQHGAKIAGTLIVNPFV